MSGSEGRGAERRRDPRRPILETFSFFVVVPKKGFLRLKVRDLSSLGIGFDLDISGEKAPAIQLNAGEEIDIRFYLNQTLSIPLRLRVARIDQGPESRRVGGEFIEQAGEGYQAIQALVGLVDRLTFVTPSA